MNRACVIELLHENPGTHGVHDAPEVERRKRFATRRSATRAEFYSAGAMGLQPSCVFVLAAAEEYDNERALECLSVVYDIIRTYETNDGGIELTAQRRRDA